MPRLFFRKSCTAGTYQYLKACLSFQIGSGSSLYAQLNSIHQAGSSACCGSWGVHERSGHQAEWRAFHTCLVILFLTCGLCASVFSRMTEYAST